MRYTYTYLQKEGCPIMGIPASLEIFCKDKVKLRRASSLTVRWGAKQAIAHSLISTPVKNCFPRISQTPPLGKACCLVRPRNEKRWNIIILRLFGHSAPNQLSTCNYARKPCADLIRVLSILFKVDLAHFVVLYDVRISSKKKVFLHAQKTCYKQANLINL